MPSLVIRPFVARLPSSSSSSKRRSQLAVAGDDDVLVVRRPSSHPSSSSVVGAGARPACKRDVAIVGTRQMTCPSVSRRHGAPARVVPSHPSRRPRARRSSSSCRPRRRHRHQNGAANWLQPGMTTSSSLVVVSGSDGVLSSCGRSAVGGRCVVSVGFWVGRSEGRTCAGWWAHHQPGFPLSIVARRVHRRPSPSPSPSPSRRRPKFELVAVGVRAATAQVQGLLDPYGKPYPTPRVCGSGGLAANQHRTRTRATPNPKTAGLPEPVVYP